MRERGGEGIDLLSMVSSDRTQRNGRKLFQRRFRLGTRKMFFTQRLAGHCDKLSSEMVAAPSLTEFKEAFGQCSQEHSVTVGDGAVQDGELESMILVSPFKISLFSDSESIIR